VENIVVNVSKSEIPSGNDYLPEFYVLAKENDPG